MGRNIASCSSSRPVRDKWWVKVKEGHKTDLQIDKEVVKAQLTRPRCLRRETSRTLVSK